MEYRLRATIFMIVAYSTRTIGIIGASAIAVVMMAIAVLISGPLPFHWNRADAASTHQLLVEYAAKDTDQDGLPDWQESLYGTDVNNPHSVNASVTDGEAVAQGLVKPKIATATTTPIDGSSIPGVNPGPDTLTDQFARTFFEEYLRTHVGQQTSPEEIATFVEKKVASLTASQGPTQTYTRATVAGSGSDAVRAYGVNIETALARHRIETDRDEVDYYADAITKDDPAALAKVNEIARMYTAIARDLIALPVPQEAAAAHLELANAAAGLGGALADMGAVDKDPLRAMLGVGRYDAARARFIAALGGTHTVFVQAGVVFDENAPGGRFYQATSLASQQQTP